jgi:hypothetical protein
MRVGIAGVDENKRTHQARLPPTRSGGSQGSIPSRRRIWNE